MDDDFNTPEALAVLFEQAREANRAREAGEDPAVAAATLRRLAGHLGLLQRDPEDFFQAGGGDGPSAEEVEALIEQRRQARADKDFATADRIRDELAEQGVVLEDGPQGTTWRRG
jgi:cysteinyl-tRNA synthetase